MAWSSDFYPVLSKVVLACAHTDNISNMTNQVKPSVLSGYLWNLRRGYLSILNNETPFIYTAGFSNQMDNYRCLDLLSKLDVLLYFDEVITTNAKIVFSKIL